MTYEEFIDSLNPQQLSALISQSKFPDVVINEPEDIDRVFDLLKTYEPARKIFEEVYGEEASI